MSEKRRDNKGRILRDGEVQRSDGSYMYRYSDSTGKRYSVYSWRLVRTDKTPERKRATEPLRELIEKIQNDLKDGIDYNTATNVDLNRMFDERLELKYEIKDSTRSNYKYMWNRVIRDDFGKMKVAAVKFNDIKKFYIMLIKDKKFKPNTIEHIQALLHPIFDIAVREGYIRKNPSEGVLAEIKKGHDWEKPKRRALTIKQQRRFVEFISNSRIYKHWMPLFTVMLGTGCRIGEVLGLRWEDCDFEQKIIDINHTVGYRTMDNGKMGFQITTPKTKSGMRIIPMFSAVYDALMELPRQANKCVIDGYRNFIFGKNDGTMLNLHIVNRVIVRIVRDANKEPGEHEKLPHFSVHNLRHTFCTRMCENESNLKVIQEIMGHKNISTTMDVYNEATKEKKMESFARLEGKMIISGVELKPE